jgi:hypothetical protein
VNCQKNATVAIICKTGIVTKIDVFVVFPADKNYGGIFSYFLHFSKFSYSTYSTISSTMYVFVRKFFLGIFSNDTFFVIEPFKPKLDFANRKTRFCKSNPNLSSGIKISFLNFSILLVMMVNSYSSLFIIIYQFSPSSN